MGEKFVVTEHPDIKESKTSVSARSFEKVWKDKGWVLVEADTPSSGSGVNTTTGATTTTDTSTKGSEAEKAAGGGKQPSPPSS